MGYKFQFITLAGFHALNLSMFELAQDYRRTGMTAYSLLQEREFERESDSGYRAVKHQAFVGTGYFDALAQAISSGTASTTGLTGSTEEEQFSEAATGATCRVANPFGNRAQRSVWRPTRVVANCFVASLLGPRALFARPSNAPIMSGSAHLSTAPAVFQERARTPAVRVRRIGCAEELQIEGLPIAPPRSCRR